MRTVIQATRSVLFLLSMTFFTLTHASVILLFFWLPRNILLLIITNWCVVNLHGLKLICGLSYRVKGLQLYQEAVKKHGGVVLMSKHQSTMETLILHAVLEPKPALVLKKELLKIPFYGWALSRIKPIAINREEKASAMEQVIERGSVALQEGRSVLIFPEGTRTPYGSAMVVKKGGVNLALAANAVIVPVALNTGLFWGKGQFIKKPGIATVSFGAGIEVTGKNVVQLQKEIKGWIDQEINTFR